MNSFIFDIRRYTIHDGPGIRTTVFFKGCPLRCLWCHNPESQEVGVEQVIVRRSMDGKIFESELAVGSWQSAADIMQEIEKDEVFYLESGGGVTFSGGEPLMQPYALKQLLELCSLKDYHTAIDTSGNAEPAALKMIMKLADLWLFDLKIMDDARHVEYTGVSNELSLKNLQTLAFAGKEIVVRFPLIPGITDGENNLEAIAGLMKHLNLNRIDLLPYHSIAKDKYRRMGKAFLLESLTDLDKERINEIEIFYTAKGFSARIGG